MRFRRPFRQERITNCARKRYIDDPANVDVPDFCAAEEELPASKTMRMYRYIRPCGYFSFEFLQVFLHPPFDAAEWPLDSMTMLRRSVNARVFSLDPRRLPRYFPASGWVTMIAGTSFSFTRLL